MQLTQSESIIKILKLQKHIQGGRFLETYRSPIIRDQRHLMTDQCVDRWHMNKSDIMHFYHKGSPIQYHILNLNGTLQSYVMGNDVTKGHLMQLLVSGNTWKACYLIEGDYGLISEAVAPGFDYSDMTLCEGSDLVKQFPQHRELIQSVDRMRPS